jgi:hypothetical protein
MEGYAARRRGALEMLWLGGHLNRFAFNAPNKFPKLEDLTGHKLPVRQQSSGEMLAAMRAHAARSQRLQ